MPTSYNGWPVLTNPPLDNSVIPGTVDVRFAPGVLAGDVATVLFFVGFWLNRNIQPAITPGCWGYSYRQNRNAANWSCHASATAADFNAPQHPNGVRGSWGAAAARIRAELLTYLEGVVQWGEDYDGTPDGMHFEIIEPDVDVARVAAKILRDFGPRENWAAGAQPAPAPVPGPAPDSQVRQDQFDLTDTGFPCTADGVWGPQSAQACRNFQFAARLAVDGIVGPVTRAALHKVPSWHSGGAIADDPGGHSAGEWQRKLADHGWHITVDGAWGDHSRSILRQFQADKGLTVDGNRGPQSWTCLFCTAN